MSDSLARGVQLMARATRQTGIPSFVLKGVHPHKVGTVLDRAGTRCDIDALGARRELFG